MDTSWNVLAVTIAGSGFAVGLLAGLWTGLRIAARDAGLLGVLDRRVATALTKSTDAMARAEQLEAAWIEQLERVETNRRRSSAERQRAEDAKRKVEEAQEAANAEPMIQNLGGIPDQLSGAERRRAIGARLRRA